MKKIILIAFFFSSISNSQILELQPNSPYEINNATNPYLTSEQKVVLPLFIILTEGNYLCGEFGYNDTLYVIRDDTLFTLDVPTMSETVIGLITGISAGQNITAISYSYSSDLMYLGTTSLSTSEFYSINLNNAAASLIGQVGQPGLMALDVDCFENVYSFDIINDQLWSINPNTGVGNPIGPFGFDANYSMHADFDLSTSILYIVAFNNSTFSNQLRTVDLVTGNSTLIQDLGGIQITVFAIEGDCGPGKAYNPQPPDSSINISINLTQITWENPVEVDGNEIWMGTDSSNIVLVLSGGLFTFYTMPDTLEYEQTYYWRVDEIGPNGTTPGNLWRFTTEEIPTNLNEKSSLIEDFLLEQNYPNPFNPSTTIKYQIPEKSFVTIKVYDVLGNELTTLVNEEKPSGSYEVEFDGTNLTSGIYFYQLRAGKYVETKKMVLLK